MSDGLCCACVSEGTVGVVENCANFSHIAQPGLAFYVPFVCYIKKRLSMRIEQLNIRCESKTLDNVFVNVEVAIQYKVINDSDSIYNAVYKLQNPQQQIR